ncbi:hypothetical protein, partial [Arsenophonus sp.]|uniref:hypothetical protein n=1 Tax=Arsenophonus sp. TaxID=1872640 RepID=UPI003878FEBA
AMSVMRLASLTYRRNETYENFMSIFFAFHAYGIKTINGQGWISFTLAKVDQIYFGTDRHPL